VTFELATVQELDVLMPRVSPSSGDYQSYIPSCDREGYGIPLRTLRTPLSETRWREISVGSTTRVVADKGATHPDTSEGDANEVGQLLKIRINS
jgi:hypothetical protein